MADIANFLGISNEACLLQPTVAGLPSTSNSSFASESLRKAERMGGFDQQLMSVIAGDASAQLGYRTDDLSQWPLSKLASWVPIWTDVG
ncbi:hypothetical protein GRI89_05035 [Altererythrobacter salegens]|uniref:Uncharacterized protein n=2 Tax=Croceibacterium salegens TaxID=1737568 RepID=A0A6I4SSP4_9SPHN|nr:hypothetical protein [Croceibacterium salegens]